MSNRIKQEGSVFARFYSDERETGAEVIEKTLSVCADIGLTEHVNDSDPLTPDNASISEKGYITVHSDSKAIRLRFRLDDWDGLTDAILSVSVDATRLVEIDPESAEKYTGPARVFVELIRQLAVELNPYYVSTSNRAIMNGEIAPTPKAVLPFETPITLERLPWLGIYSEPLIERFGGRQRVLDTPAWMVEELENGSILIVTTRIPWEDYGHKHPADRYLLDRMDRADAVSPPSDVTLSDPFASFDPGAIGTDICVHQDDIAPEFANEDLQLIPVRVDEHRNLRHLDTNAFVRNVVTNTTGDKAAIVKRMLSDVPATSDDDLYVSALLRDVIPPAFVRLDDPDNENVVTKVMRLETDVNKIKLLVSLSRVAQQDDFTTEDLNSMEGALDTLNELDDNENIDQYIEAKLL
ncbi:hypothetical protein [Haloarcula sp. CGMCC 1.2071]|uniref:hypothetical protein n=1 Tax=Haloarcula sp. CGMCC 1.2071 TaxID=3111454 RepID=UPI00300F0559